MKKEVDKSKEINTSINLINDKLNFKGTVGHNTALSIDYTAPLGDDLGYTSLELLLFSLASCIGSTVLILLRKMRKNITGCEIHSKGIRKEEHPTGFKTILMEINLNSADTTMDDLNKILKLSEDTYCPVWSMLKGNVEIDITFTIIP